MPRKAREMENLNDDTVVARGISGVWSIELKQLVEPYRSMLLNHDKREAERDELVMFVKWIRCGTDGDSHSVATGECIERAADLLKKLGV